MPRALVTGAAGFLGAHLASALERAGFEVRGVDLAGPAPVDVRDQRAMRAAVEGCDVVVDNVALVLVSRATRDEYRSVNVDGCRTTLAAARAAGAYVLHISSSAIFGIPERVPVTDDSPFAPIDAYGESKAAAERVVEEERERGLAVASLRPRTLVGAGRLGVFDVVFGRVRDGKRVPVFGRGGNKIQLCDLDDFCAAAMAAVERRAVGDYNVGSAGFGTVREDMEALIEHAGTGARVRPVPVWAVRSLLGPLALAGRSPVTGWHWRSGSLSFWFDTTRTEAELGWRPRRTNAEALVAAYDDYLRSPERGSSPHRRGLGGLVGRLLRG